MVKKLPGKKCGNGHLEIAKKSEIVFCHQHQFSDETFLRRSFQLYIIVDRPDKLLQAFILKTNCSTLRVVFIFHLSRDYTRSIYVWSFGAFFSGEMTTTPLFLTLAIHPFRPMYKYLYLPGVSPRAIYISPFGAFSM